MVINVSIAKKKMGSYIHRNKLWLSLCECISLSLIVNIDDCHSKHFSSKFLFLSKIFKFLLRHFTWLVLCQPTLYQHLTNQRVLFEMDESSGISLIEIADELDRKIARIKLYFINLLTKYLFVILKFNQS